MINKDVHPIGFYERVPFGPEEESSRGKHIRDLPKLMESAVSNFTEEDFRSSYRDGGWNFSQVVHHVADSHMVGYLRCKLILTVENPTLPVYPQDDFAEMADVVNVPANHSLTFLHSLHTRWLELMLSVSGDQWDRVGTHPESKEEMSLWTIFGLYAWHGRHHAMQIIKWRERENR